MASPQIQNLARRLLLLEAARDPASELDVAVRVIEEFRVRLIKLAGIHGFRSLLSRALKLAQTKTPSLQDVQISAAGCLEGIGVEQQQAADTESGLILVAHLLELLVTFIGESLTLQLVRDVWPEVSTGETSLDRLDSRTEEQS